MAHNLQGNTNMTTAQQIAQIEIDTLAAIEGGADIAEAMANKTRLIKEVYENTVTMDCFDDDDNYTGTKTLGELNAG